VCVSKQPSRNQHASGSESALRLEQSACGAQNCIGRKCTGGCHGGRVRATIGAAAANAVVGRVDDKTAPQFELTRHERKHAALDPGGLGGQSAGLLKAGDELPVQKQDASEESSG